MATTEITSEELEPQHASDGAGPLLQRDYCGVVSGGTCTPEALLQRLLTNFPDFSPAHIAHFKRPEGIIGPLGMGDEMTVQIKAAGEAHVRIVHLDDRTVTMQTLSDHPEAGRITFGATTDEAGHLVFRIRSRARAKDAIRSIGYQLMGQGLQTDTWVTFVRRVAEYCGGTLVHDVQVTTQEAQPVASDFSVKDAPTFRVDG